MDGACPSLFLLPADQNGDATGGSPAITVDHKEEAVYIKMAVTIERPHVLIVAGLALECLPEDFIYMTTVRKKKTSIL